MWDDLGVSLNIHVQGTCMFKYVAVATHNHDYISKTKAVHFATFDYRVINNKYWPSEVALHNKSWSISHHNVSSLGDHTHNLSSQCLLTWWSHTQSLITMSPHLVITHTISHQNVSSLGDHTHNLSSQCLLTWWSHTQSLITMSPHLVITHTISHHNVSSLGDHTHRMCDSRLEGPGFESCGLFCCGHIPVAPDSFIKGLVVCKTVCGSVHLKKP